LLVGEESIDAVLEAHRRARFDLSGGNLCLDFANTLDHRPSEHPTELLVSYNALLHFAEDAGMIEPRLKSRLVERAYLQEKESQHTLEAAITLREAIYQIFWAIINKKPVPPLALAQLNGAVQYAGEHSQLMQKGSRFAWSFDELGGFDVVLWPIARAAADLLTSDQLPYIHACSSKSCQWLFLDTSKNHRRRWCDMKVCGNRAKARKFYSRAKQD
jgi:predicted RNA-binding Zn ribbon-like protein